jgi:uncharacterized protein (TIGR02217 family)
MPNYIDHRLDARVSRQFRRITSGKTDITFLDNGDENRNAARKHKLMNFTANFAMLTPEAQQQLVAAFYAANAMLYYFRFRDHGDYKVTKSPLATIEDTHAPVQLTKRYQFGPAYADRTVQAVVTCKVYDGNGDEFPGTFDGVFGLFTPTSAWGAGPYTWSGTFDLWVRFASDDFDMTMQTLDIATADVELKEGRARAA